MSIEDKTDSLLDPSLIPSEEKEVTEEQKNRPDAEETDPLAEISASETNSPVASPDVRKHLNETLLQKAREMREQLHVILERIDKIEESKEKIKENVYSKVATDYQTRLDESRRDFLKMKEEIDSELVGLRHKEAEATRKVMEHEDTLEEAQFRHELGEFSKSDFEATSSKEKAVLEQARSEQDALQGAIKQYEAIFEGEELAALLTTSTPIPENLPPAADITDEVEPPPAAPSPNVGAGEPRAVSRHGEPAVKSPSPDTDRHPADSGLPPTVILYEKGKEIGNFEIKEELSIGRSPSNEISLQEPRISRRHAVIRHSGHQYMLIDNNSSNGTYVNGEAVTEYILKPGDKLQIGSFELLFKT